MTCFIAQNLLSELVDGALPASRADELQAHLSGCSNCTRELEEIRRVRSMLRSLPVRRAPADFLSKVKAKAERKSVFDRVVAVIDPVLRLPRPAQAGLAFAASLVIAVMVFWENGPGSVFDLAGAPGSRPAPVSEVANVPPDPVAGADVPTDPAPEREAQDALAFAEIEADDATKDAKQAPRPTLAKEDKDVAAVPAPPAPMADALARRQAEGGGKGQGGATYRDVSGGLTGTGVATRSEAKSGYVPPSSPGLYASTPAAPAATPQQQAAKPQPRMEPVPAEKSAESAVASTISEESPEPAYEAGSLDAPSDDWGGGAGDTATAAPSAAGARYGQSASTIDTESRGRAAGKKESARSLGAVSQDSVSKRKDAAKASAPAASGPAPMAAGEAEPRDESVAASEPAPVAATSAPSGNGSAGSTKVVSANVAAAVTTLSGKFRTASASGPAEVVDAARAAGGRLVSPTATPPGLGKVGASTVVIVEVPASAAAAFEEKLRAGGTLERGGAIPAEGMVRYRLEVVRE